MGLATDTRHYCTFWVSRLHLAIDAERVEEVVDDVPVTPVPMAHSLVNGVINRRGQVLTALDLHRALGVRRTSVHPDLNIVVTSTTGESIALQVSDIEDVVSARLESHQAIPQVSARLQAVTDGVFTIDNQLIVVIDPDRLITRVNQHAVIDPSRRIHR